MTKTPMIGTWEEIESVILAARDRLRGNAFGFRGEIEQLHSSFSRMLTIRYGFAENRLVAAVTFYSIGRMFRKPDRYTVEQAVNELVIYMKDLATFHAKRGLQMTMPIGRNRLS